MSGVVVSNESNQTGFAGKLPAHDDFIEAGGSIAVRQRLMDWARRSLIYGREGGKNRFTDMFLTMPIWRFFLEPGICTEQSVAGIFCPSTDRVGRAFPILIVSETTPCNAACAFTELANWFESMEALALRGLEDNMTMQSFKESLLQVPKLSGPWDGPQPVHTDIQHLAVDYNGLPCGTVQGPGCWIALGDDTLPPLGLSHSAAPEETLFMALVAAEHRPKLGASRS